MSRLDAKMYLLAFEVNPDGKKVFEELCNTFYDKQSYVRGDTHETAFNEGSKAVIQFIMNKMAQANNNNNNGELEE